jgi:outer membrane protein assembly factor BamA
MSDRHSCAGRNPVHLILNFQYHLILILLLLSLWSQVFAADNLILEKVELTGLATIPTSEVIKSLNLQPQQVYDSELIPLIKERLNEYFVQKGYYFVRIEHTDIIPVGNKKVTLVFKIIEGQTGYLTDIKFNGNKYFTSDKLIQLLELPPFNQIKLTGLPGLQSNILNLYTSRGYLFAQVKLDSLTAAPNRLTAVLTIDEGPLFTAEKYKFSGNKITKANTLLRISGLSQAQRLTPDIISQAENNLLQKQYIKDCTIVPLDAETLGIEITESKMTKIEGVAGLATNQDNNKRNLNGYINIQFLNLWGTDRALALYWKRLRSDYQILELSYHESGINKYPVAGDISFQRTIQDSAWIKMKTEVQIYYNSLYHKLGTAFSSETLYPDSPDSLSLKKTDYRNASLFWEYNKSDYAPNPTAGNMFKIKSGFVFSSASDTTKTIPINEIDGFVFIPLKQRFVLAVGIHYREISDSNAKVYEQYKLGGFHSIRGYNEDAFSSWRLGWINMELRYLMSKDSRIYFLLDDGFLQLDKSEVKTDLWGTGIGCSFKTKLGVMSVSYALSITDKRLAGLNEGLLHIGLDSSF